MSQEMFISAVMERPALWQSKNPNYKNKNLKQKMWEEIKQMFPGNEVPQLQKRWKNLKDNYRKEIKKIPPSKSGDPGRNDHDNKWKYFELMSFVKDEIVALTNESNLMEISNTGNEGETLTVDGTSENLVNIEDVQSPASVQSSSSTQSSVDKPSRKRPTPNELRAEYLEIEKRKLQLLESDISRREGSSNPEKSDDYHFLMSILPEMEKLPPLQKMRLRNKINQALMEEMNICVYGESFGRYGYNTQPL